MRRTPSYGRHRNSSSDARSTPDRFPYSPTPSSYSDASTARKSTSGQSAVAVAARSVVGVFVGCFTPPETKSSASFGDSEEFKPRSVFSDASGAGSERRRSSGSSRGAYASSNNSRRERQAGCVKFTMDEIYRATNNFSPSSKIGQGGFGTVYKGRLEDGTLVAIKRAKKSVYDKHLGVEFQSEIQMLSQVEHLSLVKFYGYVEYEDEKVVVVEYVPNGTLREHLDCLHGNILDLAARLDIAIDVAHAVTYLHMYTDHPIIHRDIKSSNILLTENFRAKVADFGFARLAADSDSGATHVSTQVKGTAGYLDPEYLRTYQLTDKSDVYSFGVLLVELVTGRRPIEPKRELKERITAKWAMKKFSDGDALLILDPRLEKSAANNLAIEKILELSLQCLAQRRQHRPSMKRCAEILWSIRKDYKEISVPDFRSSSTRSQRSILTE
ncbi:calmodulin-binding receptor-like cytoplasmic kinase 2 [Rosa rugosa]|uniref:calmodulin-binding receptor-like cytoplasmic kinase 2 n=1 Tax=Rosa rugosa TaxID=74645 RepID=UPI002B411449|nr:calmodulin-binding receptor-like cytoplasmic kinase 2 [Rosa rugosa]